MTERLLPETLNALQQKVAKETGLDFSPPKDKDLESRNVLAAKAFGFPSPESFARWVASPLTEEQNERWIDSLTVGETFFRREPEIFEALETEVLPALVEANQSSRRLRIWCAGCSTGEEPYSLAISLKRARLDLQGWKVTILGTDLNTTSLKKAEAGLYGPWSFRNTPSWFREQYFVELSDNVWEVRPELRENITFRPLNLVAAFQGPDAVRQATFDLILCRNVLMYFSAETTRAVLRGLKASLAGTGLLLVSASELSLKGLEEFASVRLSGSLAFRKVAPTDPAPPFSSPALPLEYRAAKQPLRLRKASIARSQEPAPPQDLDAVRGLADLGRWPEALDLCQKAIKGGEPDPSAQYLLAVVYMEMAKPDEAIRALQKAVYLDPSHLLAHFSLGHLLQGKGLAKAARKCFENALEVDLGPTDQILPESDGLTVGQFRELVRQTLQPGNSL